MRPNVPKFASTMGTAARACPSCHTSLPDEAQFCLRCGVATPTDPGVPPRTATTGVVEVAQVKKALADHYKIERVLGEGGMATVYLAEDLKHHRKVAVKVMRPELAATLGADRFLREVQIAAQLNHPHILPVHDSGEADGLLYYVMPFEEGQTLRERLQKESQLPVDEALRLAREVAEALAYAHSRGIVHRDIKPGNVLLNAGHALVADFGIARAVEGSGESLTRTGLAVGTPQYMAPEQAMGDREVDGRADVYAVGAMLYEMIAGEPPFTGPSPRAILTRSMTEAPRSLARSRAGLPAVMDTVVGKALAKSPADRYPTADALAQALDRTLDASRSGHAAIEPVGAGPGPLQVWGLFALVSLAMLALVYALMQRWNLPSWTLGLAVGLLAVGAGVLVATGRIEAQRRAGRATFGAARLFTWKNTAFGGLLAMLLWSAVATAFALRGPGGTTGAGDVAHVAVLPFQNRGAEADAYVVDGIADQIRGKLARVTGLLVTASTSADQYRGSGKTPQAIASELGVDYLLVGRVSWATDANGVRRVQVVPELIDGRTGATTWQQPFDTDLTDVFQIQAQIATRVASALGAQLGSREQQELAERPTTNAAAYDLYLKGRALTSIDAGTQRQAAAFFEQAVALDSTFVDAWSALSRSLARVFSNGSRDPVVAARAKAAMERTLALDPNGSLGHIAAARYYRVVDLDDARASAEIEKALRADPNDAEILATAATNDVQAGRIEAALVKLARARELDPRSGNTLALLHQAYVISRRYAEALDAGEAARALVPGDLNVVEWQAIAYAAQGDLRGAQSVVQAATERDFSAPVLVAFFAGYQEMAWVFEEREQQLLFRLTPAAFDNDRAWWGQSLATAYWQRGNVAMARAYADSALPASAQQLNAAPDDVQLLALYGVVLAYAGRREEAKGLVAKAEPLLVSEATNTNYVRWQLIRISLALGDTEDAITRLEDLVKRPYFITPAWLRIDPTFRSLKGNPRFERLIAQP
jgi:eukaryotic-like serine/threonine-protein kinase